MNHHYHNIPFKSSYLKILRTVEQICREGNLEDISNVPSLKAYRIGAYILYHIQHDTKMFEEFEVVLINDRYDYRINGKGDYYSLNKRVRKVKGVVYEFVYGEPIPDYDYTKDWKDWYLFFQGLYEALQTKNPGVFQDLRVIV